MKRLVCLILLIGLASPVLAQYKDVKKAVKTVDKVVDKDYKNSKDNDWDDVRKGSKKHGKPSNPGKKGRTNAELKKAGNPGKGNGKNDGLGGALLDELSDDDDKKGGKNKGKKKK